MVNKKIQWCLDKGMKLIDPSDNLAEEYYANAEETVRVTLRTGEDSNMWLATHKYYAEYFAAYSILMKVGIKSEIHSCTIDVIKLLEDEKFLSFSIADILEHDKQLRIDNQYYLKNRPVSVDAKELSKLLLDVRQFLDTISKDTI